MLIDANALNKKSIEHNTFYKKKKKKKKNIPIKILINNLQ